MTGAGSPNGAGMFKKKNPFLAEEVAKPAEQSQKTFMRSPKAVNQFKSPSNNAEYQAAEMIPPEANNTLGIKRVSSVEYPAVKTEKKFKKSDFIIGKKMGKGQFGEVMLVQHKDTGFLCGLKVMSKKQII